MKEKLKDVVAMTVVFTIIIVGMVVLLPVVLLTFGFEWCIERAT